MIPSLSPRLETVAALVPPGFPVADIGTDHAKLPVFLVGSGRVPFAVAIDEKSQPLQGATALVTAEGLSDRVSVRLGVGGTPLAPDEVHTITICGMGGAEIVRILENTLPAGVHRLVLQPNTDESLVRAWLAEHGWAIDAEGVVYDNGRCFTLFAAGRGKAPKQDAATLAYGNVAHHLDPDALRSRLSADRARLNPILVHQKTERGRKAVRAQLERITQVEAKLE